MSLRLNTDALAGCFGLLFAAVFWFSRGELSRLSIIFPRAILFIMAIISMALLVRGVVKASRQEVEVKGSFKRLLVIAVSLFVWWYGVVLFGFLPTTLLVYGFFVYYLARLEVEVNFRRLALWLILVMAVVFLFYSIFYYILHVQPPTGQFFNAFMSGSSWLSENLSLPA